MEPIIGWYATSNTTATEVTQKIDYGVVNSDETSDTKVFFIVNNRAGTEDVPNAEDVTFTTRDMNGGDGSTPGQEVEAVKNNWFEVRCDSLSETAFTPVGKGGVGTANPSGIHKLGTNGTTTNINAATATEWTSEATLGLDTYVKPTADNGFIYKVTLAGQTGVNEPTWLPTSGAIITDGGVKYVAYKVDVKPEGNILLGMANNMNPDGSDADLAGGNWTQISAKAEVPIDAKSGINRLQYRVN